MRGLIILDGKLGCKAGVGGCRLGSRSVSGVGVRGWLRYFGRFFESLSVKVVELVNEGNCKVT